MCWRSNEPVVVAGRRHAACRFVVCGTLIRQPGAEGDGLGAIEDKGARLLEDHLPSVTVLYLEEPPMIAKRYQWALLVVPLGACRMRQLILLWTSTLVGRSMGSPRHDMTKKVYDQNPTNALLDTPRRHGRMSLPVVS